MKQGKGLTKERLLELLEKIQNLRVGMMGDICLDVYWHIDMRRSQLSRETPHYNLPVDFEKYAPGAGGNVAKNIAALRPKKLLAVGLIGDDWRGQVLAKCLEETGVDLRYTVLEPGWITSAYCKPVRRGISPVEQEDARIDFASFSPPSEETEKKLLSAFLEMAQQVDVICVADQFTFGCVTSQVRDAVQALGKEGKLMVADSRERIGLFSHCVLKPNEFEATCSQEIEYREGQIEKVEQAAKALALRNQSRVCATLGEKGCLLVEQGKETIHLPSCPTPPPIDFCGAGDTFLAAFACGLAAGGSMEEAAALGTLSSSVTILKLQETGTASPEEIIKRFSETHLG